MIDAAARPTRIEFHEPHPVHLCRGPVEPAKPELREFYDRLFRCLPHPSVGGDWELLECTAAWDGNWSWECFICFGWHGAVPYDRHGDEICSRGLYLDLPAWGYHVFELTAVEA